MMEFNKAYQLFIDAVASKSLQNLRQHLKQLKAINECRARKCCLKTLCSLTEEEGYIPFIKEIIGSPLFKSPHNHFFLPVAPTFIYNTAHTYKSTETVHHILIFLASRSKLDINEILDILDEDGFSALHLSVINGDVKVVKILLELGSNCNKKSQSGNTALSLSIAYGHDYLVPLFLHKSDVNTHDSDHDTPLMFAAWNKEPNILSALIQYGADVNKVSKHGSTALWNAVYRSSPECVLILLSHNSRTDIACEGTHLFLDENDCNHNGEVAKIYPGNKRSLLWVAVDRIGVDEQSLKVLLILIEAGYDVTKECWLNDVPFLLPSKCPKLLHSNPPLQCVLHFLNKRPQSLKDLCRNSLRLHHRLSNLRFHDWIQGLRLPSVLKDFFILSYCTFPE